MTLSTRLRTRPRPTGRAALAVGLGMLFAVAALPASAHEFWIAPSRYAATPGAPIELAAVAGTGFRGERKPWSPDRSVRFVLETARTVDLTRAASPGDIVWTRFAPSDPGGAMVSFESSFLPIELPPAQFDAYLADEGLDGPLTSRRSAGGAVPGRERYRRCAKLWLAGLDGARATRPLGLPLELVPAGVPGAEPRLTLRVLADGAPLAGAMVKAWRAPFGSDGAPRAVAERDSVAAVWRGRSDARGEVAIPVAEAGEWLVSAVRMVPSRDQSAADWESTWASLTFARMGPAPASRAAAVRSGATRPAAAGRAARGTGALPGGRPSAGAP